MPGFQGVRRAQLDDILGRAQGLAGVHEIDPRVAGNREAGFIVPNYPRYFERDSTLEAMPGTEMRRPEHDDPTQWSREATGRVRRSGLYELAEDGVLRKR